MATTIQKWGNSLGVRIPKNIAEDIGLNAGDDLSVSLKGRSILLSPNLKPKLLDLKKVMKNYKPETYHNEVDCGISSGNEVW
jgi:antitoxin MazE